MMATIKKLIYFREKIFLNINNFINKIINADNRELILWIVVPTILLFLIIFFVYDFFNVILDVDTVSTQDGITPDLTESVANTSQKLICPNCGSDEDRVVEERKADWWNEAKYSPVQVVGLFVLFTVVKEIVKTFFR